VHTSTVSMPRAPAKPARCWCSPLLGQPVWSGRTEISSEWFELVFTSSIPIACSPPYLRYPVHHPSLLPVLLDTVAYLLT
jgi:hypothetical protein